MIREQEVKINLNAYIISQITHMWAYYAWENINTMRLSWPRLQRLDQSPDVPQRSNYKDIEINPSSRFKSLNSDDIGSVSGKEFSDDYESSEEEDGIFKDSEREDSLDDWMYNMDNQHVLSELLFCRNLGYSFMDIMAVESAKEFLELLFELSISLAIESFIDR